VLDSNGSPGLALSRVAVRVELTRVALLDGTRLRGAWGDWPEPSELLAGVPDPLPPDLDRVPARLRPLLAADSEAAVLGWHGPHGPFALPGYWDATGWAQVPTVALRLGGALSAGPACLTVETSGTRPSSVRGLQLNGLGRARSDDATTRVTIAAERTVWWSGDDSGTLRTPVAPNA
uniref:hypothetical protein n=1 Tax=Sporichthya sp. TaxID=65475 RepID=UPI0017F77301